MKDALLLREYGRTAAIFAGAGFILSLLVGLLARNPFGVMLLRAILFAVAFGGIGAGMQYVVRRFLPEIAGGGAAPPEGTDAPAAASAGSTVDIVLPEEPPPAAEAPEGRGETLEELPGTGEAAGATVVEELDSAEDEAAPEPPSATRPGETARGAGGLDALLPDVDPFGSDGTVARRGGRIPGTRAKPSDATRDVLERQDPAELARGLRTMLKRDERP